MGEDEGHPILAGLAALVGVALAVGVLVGGGALLAASTFGLTGSEGTGTSTSQQSMYLPKPSETAQDSGPRITLRPGETTSETTTSEAPEFEISLSASPDEVNPMQEIYLTGAYPGGDGAVVQVQRFENGKWDDFATVDAVVNGDSFSTYVQTARAGENRFRVKDTSGPAVSNEVVVRVR